MGAGDHHISAIYAAVQRRLPALCDDRYLCVENCGSGHPKQPEWKHKVRSTLEDLKKLGLISRGAERGLWVVGSSAASAKAKGSKRDRGLAAAVAAQRGAGFGSPAENQKVEAAAVKFVTRHYQSKGWRVQDVCAENRGYDLVCKKAAAELHVEVKGVRGYVPRFIITAREERAWASDRRYVLALVTGALGKTPSLICFPMAKSHAQFAFHPISFFATHRPNSSSSGRDSA